MADRLVLESLGVSKRDGDRDALCDVDLIARPGGTHLVLCLVVAYRILRRQDIGG